MIVYLGKSRLLMTETAWCGSPNELLDGSSGLLFREMFIFIRKISYVYCASFLKDIIQW